VDGQRVDFDKLIYFRGSAKPESVFHIPAQRVLILKNGWPRPFMDYAGGDPFCVRSFSEHVRQLMEAGLGSGASPVFPQQGRLKKALRNSLDDSIFNGATVRLDTEGLQKRLVLDVGGRDGKLSYMAWSAGQREFMPLLLGLYWLIPPTKIRKKKSVRWVIIEEPEMGLHPKAIFSFMLLVLELMSRGYRVIVSTHSPTILDVVWAVREIRKSKAPVASMRDLFHFRQWWPGLKELFDATQAKELRTYFFDKKSDGIHVRDISSLDPGHDDEAVSGWGGLAGFSGHVADVVASAVGGEYE
jgi:hypothetical protein